VEHEVRNRYFLWNYNPLPEHDLVHIHVMDDTERKRMEEQLVHDAFHDALTGLPNRALLLDRAEQRLDHARRSPGMFALFFIDLDRFKTINDSLGHTVGDALLVQAAEAMVRAMGDCCTLARLGGDEFVVLVDEITDESDALELAQTLQHAVAGPFTVDGLDIAATASIGVVVDEGAYPDAETMLRDADTAMYRAKASGRAQCALFDEAMHETARKRLDLEMDLNRALGGDQLVAFYQPIVCLRTGRITGFEALLRWLHPERGLISPGDFIPVAEETGLIVPIGLDVLEQACTQAQAWRRLREDLGELMMSVNLSVRQFRSPTLLEDIRGVLERTGFPGRLLKLEITESGVMEHGPRAKEIMAGLEDMGASLSIDDFGTGYSSLSYLPRFPFHSLKVDRSFVMRMHEPDNLGIVQTIVALAHDMDKEVIAEGVETEAMLAVLREMGCEYAQGFLFAKPLPPEEAQTLLEQAPRW
jgi:diguanylate cyclase (GGDEF)-like protein